MNVFAKFDEIPSMILKVIKETKRYGHTVGRSDNVKTVYPPTNTVCGGYNNDNNNIFIYNKDNMHFKMTVILTYSPPMTTDDGYYRTISSDLFASDKMHRRREASAVLHR